MKLDLQGLQQLLATHVCEVSFVRRKNKPGYSQGRRMLCTNNYPLLNSPPGRIALNFKPPTKRPPFNAASHNLVTCWDILWQDYRNISVEYNNVIAAMPLRTPEEIGVFWQYFEALLKDMSPADKIRFMSV